MSRRTSYTRPNNYVKFQRKAGVRSTAKLAKAVAGLNRARKMQVMRGPMYVSRRAGRVVQDRLGENKYLDTVLFNNTAIGSDLAAASAVQSLNIVAQGNTVNTRIGKKIRAMRLQVKGRFNTSTAAGADTQVRVAIVWDREPDKAALVPVAGSDIYLSTDPASLTNRDNAPRFRILKEEMFTFPGTILNGASADDDIQHFEWFMDFTKKDLEVIWTKADSTGAVAAMIKGDLLFVVQSSNAIAGSDLFLTANARLDYDDESSHKRG